MQDGARAGRDVVLLELVDEAVVENVGIGAGPARLAAGVDLKGKVPEMIARPIIEAEVTLMRDQYPGIILVERNHRRVFRGDRDQITASIGVGSGQRVG